MELVTGLIYVLHVVLQMVMYLIFASVVISWVSADPGNPLVGMIHSCTDPIYRPLRKLTANFPGPIDWAPMVAMLVIIFLMKGVLPFIAATVSGASSAPAMGGM
jgi:uncharacterized protein YggT (Ycf19 family)